ncbi:MAG: WYL domain-containing protein, partial [Ktedonobacteraceae bacterium]
MALTLGLQAVQKMGVHAIAPAIEGAMAKIERVLPDNVRPRIQAVHDMLVVDMNSPDAQIELPILETLSTAAGQCRQVQLCYHTEQDEITERIIDPYGVACHNGHWYTAGYCHLRTELRIFRLDRIEQAKILQEVFTPPPDFHCLHYIVQSVAAIPDTWNVEVLLMIPLDEARTKIPPMLATLDQHPQGVVLYASIANLNWMARFLVGLGCSFIIHQPIELRTTLQELAEEMSHLAQLMPD